MKGIVLYFNNEEKKGLILGVDGNRYSFDWEIDWQNKIKIPEINSEVDFIINQDMANKVYCLNNQNINNTPQINKIKSNSNLGFKKVDFDEIEKNGNDQIFVKNFRSRMSKYLILFSIILILTLSLLDKDILPNFLLYFISFFLGMAVLGYFLSIIFPKSGIKDEYYRKKYSKELPMINYSPDGLNYEIIEMITINSKNYDNALKDITRKAYKLKADAIINFIHNENNITVVRTVGFGFNKRIETKTTTTHKLQGVAIRLI